MRRPATKRGFTLEEAERIATEIGIDWNTSKFGPEEFRKGLDVELEHGRIDSRTDVTNNDPILTGKIAWAHLLERPDYYELLELVESGQIPVPPEPEETGFVQIHSQIKREKVMSKLPRFIRVHGFVYELEPGKQAPEFIRVEGQVFKRMTDTEVREAKKKSKKKKNDGWKKLPKGWTKKSAKEFWNSLTKDAPKHKVTECIRELKGAKEIDDAGAFCASLADMVEGPAWRHEPRKKKKKKEEAKGKKKKKAAAELPEEYDIPVKFSRSDHELLAGLYRGQGDPVYALVSRTTDGRETMTSPAELEAAVEALGWLAESEQASDDEREHAEELKSFLEGGL